MLVAGDDHGDFRPFGSAFLAGPALAFTARHVIDDVFDHFTGRLPHKAGDTPPFGLQLGTASIGTNQVQYWDVVGYHHTRDIDITGLVLEPAGGSLPAAIYPRFNLVPPKEGEQVFAAGHANTTWQPTANAMYHVALDLALTSGSAREVHHKYRDRATITFPCFRTDARFDAGMSGGPVFNADGQVCGVICSSFPPAEPEEEHASYVSLIWPAFGLRLCEAKPAFASSSTFVLDEAIAGRLQVLNLDYMSVTPGPSGDALHFEAPARMTD
jgi:hypothetical protein